MYQCLTSRAKPHPGWAVASPQSREALPSPQGLPDLRATLLGSRKALARDNIEDLPDLLIRLLRAIRSNARRAKPAARRWYSLMPLVGPIPDPAKPGFASRQARSWFHVRRYAEQPPTMIANSSRGKRMVRRGQGAPAGPAPPQSRLSSGAARPIRLREKANLSVPRRRVAGPGGLTDPLAPTYRKL
jgi:hypothetical protein